MSCLEGQAGSTGGGGASKDRPARRGGDEGAHWAGAGMDVNDDMSIGTYHEWGAGYAGVETGWSRDPEASADANAAPGP